MTNHENLAEDVFAFLDEIVAETPETCFAERQELFRIALTQAMRNVRKETGLTQSDLAQRLGVGQSWVSKLESANNDHTFESVLAYLNALDADFRATILLNENKRIEIPAKLRMSKEEFEAGIETIFEDVEVSSSQYNSELSDFELISSEDKNKCQQAQACVESNGLWGTAA
jgi:transcriptional regulator with XRE-family HTH domain